jgi:hypothetical protein
MEPLSPRPSTSPRPKKKFSLRNLRARFASTSNVDLNEDLQAAVEWGKLQSRSREEAYETVYPYPYSPSGISSGTSSPTASSQTSSREREKILPAVPNAPNSPPTTSATVPRKRIPSDMVMPNGMSGIPHHKIEPPEDLSAAPSPLRSPEYVALTDGHTRQGRHSSTTDGLFNSGSVSLGM